MGISVDRKRFTLGFLRVAETNIIIYLRSGECAIKYLNFFKIILTLLVLS